MRESKRTWPLRLLGSVDMDRDNQGRERSKSKDKEARMRMDEETLHCRATTGDETVNNCHAMSMLYAGEINKAVALSFSSVRASQNKPLSINIYIVLFINGFYFIYKSCFS